MFINNTELTVVGKFLKTARLRHEWCEYLTDPLSMIASLRQGPRVADVFTFIHEVCDKEEHTYKFNKESSSAAVLSISTYNVWWDNLGYKVRNKIRKAIKNGVEVRLVNLSDDLVEGVVGIYNESPVRQGKKFWHYGKDAEVIKQDLSPFLDRCIFLVRTTILNLSALRNCIMEKTFFVIFI